MLLSEEIQFLSWGFPFLAVSKISRVGFRLFVSWNVSRLKCTYSCFLSYLSSLLFFFYSFMDCSWFLETILRGHFYYYKRLANRGPMIWPDSSCAFCSSFCLVSRKNNLPLHAFASSTSVGSCQSRWFPSSYYNWYCTWYFLSKWAKLFKLLVLFTQPLRSGRIWHKVNF